MCSKQASVHCSNKCFCHAAPKRTRLMQCHKHVHKLMPVREGGVQVTAHECERLFCRHELQSKAPTKKTQHCTVRDRFAFRIVLNASILTVRTWTRTGETKDTIPHRAPVKPNTALSSFAFNTNEAFQLNCSTFSERNVVARQMIDNFWRLFGIVSVRARFSMCRTEHQTGKNFHVFVRFSVCPGVVALDRSHIVSPPI